MGKRVVMKVVTGKYKKGIAEEASRNWILFGQHFWLIKERVGLLKANGSRKSLTFQKLDTLGRDSGLSVSQ